MNDLISCLFLVAFRYLDTQALLTSILRQWGSVSARLDASWLLRENSPRGLWLYLSIPSRGSIYITYM